MKRILILIAFFLPLSAAAQLVDNLEGTSGSGLGPGKALYVTQNNAVTGGKVTRVDTKSGATSTFAEGLPTSGLFAAAGFGGAVDVTFIGRTAYVLVTGVAAPFGNGINGIYRIEGPNSYSIIADIGAWASALENLPTEFPYVIATGIQYSIEAYKGGFLVSDGHHNRILFVTLSGEISEYYDFGSDVVPTGLDVKGQKVYMAAAGPVPHVPETGAVYGFRPNGSQAFALASGEPLIVDVERSANIVYAISQGIWEPPPGCEVDPAPCAGAPATSDSGALVRINDGEFEVLASDLDLPTSLEVIRKSAYVVTLSGQIFKFEGVR